MYKDCYRMCTAIFFLPHCDRESRDGAVVRALYSYVGGVCCAIMACTGRLWPKGVPLSGFRYLGNIVGIFEVHERVEKSVNLLCYSCII